MTLGETLFETHFFTRVFFVDLEPNRNNKDIYRLDPLLSAKIQIEPPRKKKLCNVPDAKGMDTKGYCRR